MAIVVSKNGKNAIRLDQSAFDDEDRLQQYIYDNPDVIPLSESEEGIRLLILAREFPTNSGLIDTIGIDSEGQLYVIETKLYRNPDKRKVIAQVLDYGAALWKHSGESDQFESALNRCALNAFGMSAAEKVAEFFKTSPDEAARLLSLAYSNLNDGVFKFVVLMDEVDERLKDLILYVNQNSQFTIYAVELEYYKHDALEIVIPRVFGAEIKKDLRIKNAGTVWNWDLFKQRLAQIGEKEVAAARQIIDWAEANGIEVIWMTNKIGSFVIGFEVKGKKGFYPFSVTGDAVITWNAPHQGDFSPQPFDKKEKRVEILKRLNGIKGAEVDVNRVDGYSAFKLPLSAMADQDMLRDFLAVCEWIKKKLE